MSDSWLVPVLGIVIWGLSILLLYAIIRWAMRDALRGERHPEAVVLRRGTAKGYDIELHVLGDLPFYDVDVRAIGMAEPLLSAPVVSRLLPLVARLNPADVDPGEETTFVELVYSVGPGAAGGLKVWDPSGPVRTVVLPVVRA